MNRTAIFLSLFLFSLPVTSFGGGLPWAMPLVNPICTKPILIPDGCYFTSLLLFNEPFYLVEATVNTAIKPIEILKGATGNGSSSSLGSKAKSLAKGLNSTTQRSAATHGAKLKEANVYELAKEELRGTLPYEIRDEECLFPFTFYEENDNGKYVYKSEDFASHWHDRELNFDLTNAITGMLCGLNGLSSGALDVLSNNIPGFSSVMNKCIGVWGTLKPTNGYSVQPSDMVHAGLVSYRAWTNAIEEDSSSGLFSLPTQSVSQINVGYPGMSSCFNEGDPGYDWENGVKLSGVGALNPALSDNIIFVYWRQSGCCTSF